MRHVFIHIGDAHLCSAHPRNGDRLNALDQIIEHVRRADSVAAVLWPGDLFHQKSTVDDRNALAPRVQALAAVAPVLLCPGNHDVPGDLDIFAKLETAWPVYVIDQPRVAHFQTATGVDAACFVLPYPHKGGLVGAGVEHGQLGQDALALLEPIVMAGAAELRAAASEGELPLAMIHVNVGGSIASTGQPQIGREIELDAVLLARLGGVHVAANHIHRHQEIHGAVYAGSICRMDFGENEAKGFVEIECVEGVWDWRFVPLDVPRQLNVEGRLTREAFVFTAIDGQQVYSHRGELLNDDAQIFPVWSGADVRVKYSYRKSEIGALDVAKIHAEVAGCRSLKLDPMPELEHDVRAPEIAAAVTIDDKVERFCALNQIPVTDLVREALSALQARDRDAVLADVRALAERAGTVEPAADMSEVA